MPDDESKSIAGAPSIIMESICRLRLFLPAIAADCPATASTLSKTNSSSIESNHTTFPVPENWVASMEEIVPETSVRSNPESTPSPIVMLDANTSVCLAHIAGPLQCDISRLENTINASDWYNSIQPLPPSLN